MDTQFRNIIASCAITGVLCFALGQTFSQYRANSCQKLKHTNCNDACQMKISLLEEEIVKMKNLRNEERRGRTAAERERRESIQALQEVNGFQFVKIGHIESCFADRRGTPRQGSLVPASRGHIVFDSCISPYALEGVQEFSHLWIIFVFHENTNATKPCRSSSVSTFPAKIAPPRLGGKKTGVFSTRTPHRPNAIGLSLVKIESVNGRCIEISGHDLVHNTPVLDVKPYVYADNIANTKAPDWVETNTDVPVRIVTFAPQVVTNIEEVISSKRSKYYSSSEELMNAIQQVLVLDIRSVYQGRGNDHLKRENIGDIKTVQPLYNFRFDTLEIQFQTYESEILVSSCKYIGKT